MAGSTKDNIMEKSYRVRATDEIRASLSPYGGTTALDIRTHFLAPNGAMTPTQKGVRIPLEEIEKFVEHMIKIREVVRMSQTVKTPEEMAKLQEMVAATTKPTTPPAVQGMVAQKAA